MAETMIDEIPISLITERDQTVREAGGQMDDEETWTYRNNQSKNEDMTDSTAAPTIDEITTQGIDTREKPTTSFIVDADDSDDDDDIQVTIGNYEPEVSTFPTNRQKNRQMLPTSPMLGPKPTTVRGVDFDAQGMINGQLTFDHDIANAYKDEEKPWKKPGADITDYFNYGFTEETWAQYSDRQRRLRAENNLARLNIGHAPPMQTMIPNHQPMGHPMMMVNRPMNMAMMQRPMNFRKPDGKIGVIGTTDQTSRRTMFEQPNNFEHVQFINGSPFPGGQPPNVQTVGDLISGPPNANGGHPSNQGTPPNSSHHIQTLGAQRIPMISLPSGMQFRGQFNHPQALGRPQFFPRGPMPGMHGDRPPQPYYIPRHPQQQQQPWENRTAVTSLHGFPPGSFPLQTTAPIASNDGRGPSSRSATPENHSSRSATPEENRTNTNAPIGENDKSKDDRYKERYRDDRDHHTSSHRSSSSSHRPHHRSGEHEYERPRNDRKSSRDRDDKYERYSRKQQHRDDSDYHRSSHRTPTKTNATPSELSQTLNDQPESVAEPGPSSPMNRSHRDDSERSSSRHSHHKKSSKRSRHDSGDERSSSHHHHHRRSSDKSNHSNKKPTDSLSDVKDQINE